MRFRLTWLYSVDFESGTVATGAALCVVVASGGNQSGRTEADLRPVATLPANSTSLPGRAIRRSYRREEPYAVIPLVRNLCGDQRWSSLPRPMPSDSLAGSW